MKKNPFCHVCGEINFELRKSKNRALKPQIRVISHIIVFPPFKLGLVLTKST